MNKYSPFPGDQVPAMLEEGEYVLNRNAVNAVGKENLDYLNKEVEPRYAQNGGYMNSNEDNWSVAQEQAQYKKNARALTARQSIESGEGIKGPAKLRKNTTPLDLYSMAEIPTNPEFNVDDWNGLVGGMSTNLRHYSDAYDNQQRSILDTRKSFWQKNIPLTEQEKYKIMRNDAIVRSHQEQDAAFQGAMKIRGENERRNVAQSKALKEHEVKTIENSLRHEGWKKEHAKGPALPPDPKKPMNPATGKPYDTIEMYQAKQELSRGMRQSSNEEYERTRAPMSLRTDASEPGIGHVATPKMPGRSRPQIVSDAQPHVEKAGHMMTNALKGYKSGRGGRYEYQTGDLVSRTGVDLSDSVEVDEYGNLVNEKDVPEMWKTPATEPYEDRSVSAEDQAEFDKPDFPEPEYEMDWSKENPVVKESQVDLDDPETWIPLNEEKPGQYSQKRRKHQAEGDIEHRKAVEKHEKQWDANPDNFEPDMSTAKVVHPPSQSGKQRYDPSTLKEVPPIPRGTFSDIKRSGLTSEPNMETVEERNPNPNISYGDDNYQKGKRTIGKASDFLNKAKMTGQNIMDRYSGAGAGRNYAAEQKLAGSDPNWKTKSQAEQQQAVIDYRNANWKEYKEGEVTPQAGTFGGAKTGVRAESGSRAAGRDIVSGIGATAQGISDLIPKIGPAAKAVGMAGLGVAGGIGLGAKKAWDYMNKSPEGGKADYSDVWSGRKKGSLLQRGRKGLGAMSMMLQDASMAQGFSGADWAGSGYNADQNPYNQGRVLGQETDEDVNAASVQNILDFQGMKEPKIKASGGLISYMEKGGEAKADSSSGIGVVDTLAMYENQIQKEQKMLAPIARQFGVRSKEYKDALQSGRKEGYFSSPEKMQKMMQYIIQRKNAGTYNMRAMPR